MSPLYPTSAGPRRPRLSSVRGHGMQSREPFVRPGVNGRTGGTVRCEQEWSPERGLDAEARRSRLDLDACLSLPAEAADGARRIDSRPTRSLDPAVLLEDLLTVGHASGHLVQGLGGKE